MIALEVIPSVNPGDYWGYDNGLPVIQLVRLLPALAPPPQKTSNISEASIYGVSISPKKSGLKDPWTSMDPGTCRMVVYL